MWYGHHNLARRRPWRRLGIGIAFVVGSLAWTQPVLAAGPTLPGGGAVTTVAHTASATGEAAAGAVASTAATADPPAAQAAAPAPASSASVAAVSSAAQGAPKPPAGPAPAVASVASTVAAASTPVTKAATTVTKPVTAVAAPVTTTATHTISAVTAPVTSTVKPAVAAVTAAVAAPLQNAGTTTSSLLPAAISPAIPRTTAAAVPVAAAAGSAVSPLTVVGRVVQGTQTTVGRQLLAGPVAPPTTAEQAGFATTADGPVLQPGGLVSATAAPPLLEAGPLGEPPQPGTTSAGSFLFGALAGLVPALLPGWSAPGAAPVPTAGAPYGAIAEAQGANAPPGPAQPAVPGGAAASAGAGIALLLTLAGLMLLWVPPAVRRLRLASESLRLAPWVLIPERPG